MNQLQIEKRNLQIKKKICITYTKQNIFLFYKNIYALDDS